VAAGEARFAAAFLSAPMMGLRVVRRSRQGARLIAQVMGGIGKGADYIDKDGYDPMLGPFEKTILTHDARRYERYRGQLRACPDLALGGVTWGWLAFALDCAARLARPSVARKATLPLTVLTAGDERLVLNAPSRKYAQHAPQGRYIEVAGAFHELLTETDPRRALVWCEFDALVERAGL
jgi:lysophospholipase